MNLLFFKSEKLIDSTSLLAPAIVGIVELAGASIGWQSIYNLSSPNEMEEECLYTTTSSPL